MIHLQPSYSHHSHSQREPLTLTLWMGDDLCVEPNRLQEGKVTEKFREDISGATNEISRTYKILTFLNPQQGDYLRIHLEFDQAGGFHMLFLDHRNSSPSIINDKDLGQRQSNEATINCSIITGLVSHTAKTQEEFGRWVCVTKKGQFIC